MLANRRKSTGEPFKLDDFMRWGAPEPEQDDDIATPEKFSALVRRKQAN